MKCNKINRAKKMLHTKQPLKAHVAACHQTWTWVQPRWLTLVVQPYWGQQPPAQRMSQMKSFHVCNPVLTTVGRPPPRLFRHSYFLGCRRVVTHATPPPPPPPFYFFFPLLLTFPEASKTAESCSSRRHCVGNRRFASPLGPAGFILWTLCRRRRAARLNGESAATFFFFLSC